MSSTRSHRRPLITCGLAALLALPILAGAPSDADADVKVRVRGHAKVRVSGPKVRVRVRGPRVHHRPHVTHRPRTRLHVGGRVVVSGGVYVGTGYAVPPPPPPPAYDCDVPAYYSRPAPVAPVVVAPAPVYRPMGPRLGLGAFAGGTHTEYSEGDDVGLIARYRLTHGLALEGELSRTENEVVETRRAGGALLWDLAPHARLSPHLVGGFGRWDDAGYGEIGAGLTWRMTDRFHLAFDLRAGVSGHDDDNTRPVAAGQVIDDTGASDEPEGYTRGRLAALLYF